MSSIPYALAILQPKSIPTPPSSQASISMISGDLNRFYVPMNGGVPINGGIGDRVEAMPVKFPHKYIEPVAPLKIKNYM